MNHGIDLTRIFESLRTQVATAGRNELDLLEYELLETVFLTRLEIPEDPHVHHSLRAVLSSGGSLEEFLALVDGYDRLLA